MMTDITCPVELLSLEQAAFDQGRRQGYLKLRNEGADGRPFFEALEALLDAQGAAAGRRPVRLEPSDAPPGQPFECRLALDEYPPFESALLLAERVAFADGSVWTPDPARMMDATPPSRGRSGSRWWPSPDTTRSAIRSAGTACGFAPAGGSTAGGGTPAAGAGATGTKRFPV